MRYTMRSRLSISVLRRLARSGFGGRRALGLARRGEGMWFGLTKRWFQPRSVSTAVHETR